jgi:chromosome partitioning protein
MRAAVKTDENFSCKPCNAYALDEEIAKLLGKVDYIIIDSPPHIEVEARSAIRSADLVLIPVQPSPTDLWATKASIVLAEQEGINTKILLNRVSGNSRLGKSIRGVFEATAKEKLLKAQLGNRVGFASAILDGLTVTEAEPSSTAAKEVKAFVAEVQKVFAAKAEFKKPVKKAVKTKAA